MSKHARATFKDTDGSKGPIKSNRTTTLPLLNGRLLLLGAVLVNVLFQISIGVNLVRKHFFIRNKAVQDGRDTHVKDIHKIVRYPIANQENDNCWASRGIQFFVDFRFNNQIISKQGHHRSNE